MTVGLFGGSYNPIHNGHTALGQWLVAHHLVDELWFLVSPQNPLKPAAGLLDDQARLHLAQLAIGRKRKLRVSDFEFHMPRPSYMVHTLEALRRHYPRREFILVIGADNWERFPQWYQSEEILRHHRLIIFPRPGCQLENLPPTVLVAETPLLDISSTAIRQQISSNPNYQGEGLPKVVWQELKNKKNNV